MLKYARAGYRVSSLNHLHEYLAIDNGGNMLKLLKKIYPVSNKFKNTIS